MYISDNNELVFGIDKYHSVTVQTQRELISSGGEVMLEEGERVTAMELTTPESTLFAIRKKSGIMLFLPIAMFGGCFETFKKLI